MTRSPHALFQARLKLTRWQPWQRPQGDFRAAAVRGVLVAKVLNPNLKRYDFSFAQLLR